MFLKLFDVLVGCGGGGGVLKTYGGHEEHRDRRKHEKYCLYKYYIDCDLYC